MKTATYNVDLINANIAMINKKADLQMEQYLQEHDLTEEEAKLNVLKDDEAFMKKVIASETPEEIQKLFAEQGVDWTIEEVMEFVKNVRNTTAKVLNATDELTEEELAEIAGGVSLLGKIAAYIGTALVAAVIGVAFGAACALTGGLAAGVAAGIFAGVMFGGAFEALTAVAVGDLGKK